MPRINRPRTTVERSDALNTAQTKVENTLPEKIPFRQDTQDNLKIAQKFYEGLVKKENKASHYLDSSKEKEKSSKVSAILYENDYLDNVFKAIRRHTFEPDVKALYSINVNSNKLPRITTSAGIALWAQRIQEGQEAQLEMGNTPVLFPSMEEVVEKADDHKIKKYIMSDCKTKFGDAQSDIKKAKEAIDNLILKMWNECETFFNKGNRSEMRKNCMAWGVKYGPINRK